MLTTKIQSPDAKYFSPPPNRISRALTLSMQKTILPQEQWTQSEADVRYLQPYVEEVQREKAEKAEWIKGKE